MPDFKYSRFSALYLPSGLSDWIPLVYYQDILIGSESTSWQISTQTDAVIGAPWLAHQSRGNAAMTMDFTVARAWPTVGQAERYGHYRSRLMHMHPQGTLRYMYAYDDDSPMVDELWDASLQTCRVLPMSADTALEPRADGHGQMAGAWIGVLYSFLLTNTRVTTISTYYDHVR